MTCGERAAEGKDSAPPYGSGTPGNCCEDCPLVPSRHCCLWNFEDVHDECPVTDQAHTPILVCSKTGERVLCDNCGTPLNVSVEEYVR